MKQPFWLNQETMDLWRLVQRQAENWADNALASMLWRHHFRDISHYWLCVRTVK